MVAARLPCPSSRGSVLKPPGCISELWGARESERELPFRIVPIFGSILPLPSSTLELRGSSLELPGSSLGLPGSILEPRGARESERELPFRIVPILDSILQPPGSILELRSSILELPGSIAAARLPLLLLLLLVERGVRRCGTEHCSCRLV